MYLEIDNPDGLDLQDFSNWIKEQLVDFNDSNNIKSPSLEKEWNKFFEENDLGWPKDDYDNPIAPTTNFILNNYFDNLIVKKQGNNYIITTDPNIKLRGTNLTVDALSALINYGTLLVPPYPYIDDIFEVFADSLQNYYNIWQEENGESLLNYEESEEGV